MLCSCCTDVDTGSAHPAQSFSPCVITVNHWLCVAFREQSVEPEANIFFFFYKM